MKKKVLFVLVILSLTLQSCAPYSNVETIGKATRAPKQADHAISIFRQSERLPAHAQVIGSLYIGDTGFSLDCGSETVMQLAKEKARGAGGDAIQITKTNPPDFFSTCYRINANIIAFAERETAATQSSTGTNMSQPGQAAVPPNAKQVEMPSGHRWKKPK